MTPDSHFPLLTMETAPEEALETLESINKKFGKIPNIIGTMANAPNTLKSYAALGANMARAGFDPIEMQLINLAISVENECRYCVSAHSTALKKGLKVDADVVRAIREGNSVDTENWNALVTTVRELVRSKGALSRQTVAGFTDAGYSKQQLLDLLTAIAMKTLTNYLDHLTQIDLDPAYQAEADSIS
jgi:uncharacterized peroxidase-related enzyme